jgi:Flp pilus assembly protein TadD
MLSLYQQGRFVVTQRLINAALVLRPNDVSAVGNLGVSYLRDGQLEAALQWFDIAVKLQPDLPVALANAADLRYHMGRFDEAFCCRRERGRLIPRQRGVSARRRLTSVNCRLPDTR